MSQLYQEQDRPGGFDYQLKTLPNLGARVFRGPEVDLARPYLAFVGAAQTFGRFVERPFPALVGERLGLGALNLGAGGAGPKHFDNPRYLSLLNGAEAVVLQVMSGRSASSSLFDNSPTGRRRGSTPLADGPVLVEEFLRLAAQKLSAGDFARVIAEMRADYVASCLKLIGKINAPRILLWFSKRERDYAEDYANAPVGVLGDFPQLVNARMVEEIAAHCDAYVECVCSDGIPQSLWRSATPVDGVELHGDQLVNRYYPSAQMHEEAARRLEAPCRRFAGRPARSRAPGPRSFVVIAAERTGTNLLINMLNQFEGVFCGNEVFNPNQIAQNKLPWLAVDEAAHARLLERRTRDPVGFLNDLRDIARERGFGVVGFKLMYNHGLAHPALLEALAADPDLMVIHVTRRNLLRRLVSERQARALKRWAVGRTETPPPLPKVEIGLTDLVTSLARTKSREAEFNALFAGHDLLEVIYEDIAERPEHVAARAGRFLGLSAQATAPTVNLRKMGGQPLGEALADAEQLRGQLRRWAAFFDE